MEVYDVKRVLLIALDMDGTLLASDHETMPADNIAAIRRADAAGVRVAISTGRMLEDVSDFINRLQLPCMIIAGNGARVSDGPMPGGHILVRRDLAATDAQRAAEILLSHELIVNAFEDGLISTVNQGTLWHYHLVTRGLIRERTGVQALREATSHDVIKLLAMSQTGENHDDIQIDQALSEIRKALPHVQVVRSAPGNIEVISPDAGKGAGLAALACKLHLPRECVMAVGDEENDLSMLQFAFHSVAMGNAAQTVKAICRYQTATNDECGVARIIERVCEAKGC